MLRWQDDGVILFTMLRQGDMTAKFRWFLTSISIFSGISIAGIFFFASSLLIDHLCPGKYLSSEITCDMDKPNTTCTLPWVGELHAIVIIITALLAVILTVLIPTFVAPSYKRYVGVISFLLVAFPLLWFCYKTTGGF